MNTLILKILCWINGIKNPFRWDMEHEEVIDNARFFMKSTHELAYDHGYSDGQIEVLDKIRAEIEELKLSFFDNERTIDAVLSIIDKYREEKE